MRLRDEPGNDVAPWVERETLIEATPEEVWEAITDEDRLEEWIAEEVELDPVEGGDASFRSEDGERSGTVQTVEEEERFAFTWARPGEGESLVEFTIEAVPAGTRLTVVETPIGPTAVAAGGWGPRSPGCAARWRSRRSPEPRHRASGRLQRSCRSDPPPRARTLARGGTVTASRLADKLPISRQAVAKHLAALRSAKLVSVKRMGSGDPLPAPARPARRGGKLDPDGERRVGPPARGAPALAGERRGRSWAPSLAAADRDLTPWPPIRRQSRRRSTCRRCSGCEEAGLPITGANIARAMQLSPPTVHEMIGRLEGDGYIERAGDKSLAFTENGRGRRRRSSAATG